jgi:hypothetical protein
LSVYLQLFVLATGVSRIVVFPLSSLILVLFPLPFRYVARLLSSHCAQRPHFSWKYVYTCSFFLVTHRPLLIVMGRCSGVPNTGRQRSVESRRCQACVLMQFLMVRISFVFEFILLVIITFGCRLQLCVCHTLRTPPDSDWRHDFGIVIGSMCFCCR